MADRSDSSGSSSSDSVWYRLGYAFERTRDTAAHPSQLKSLAERMPGAKDAPSGERRPARRSEELDEEGAARHPAVDLLLTAGAGTLAARLLDLWPARGKPGVTGLMRAGLAGAGAALARQLLRPVLEGRRPEIDEELAEALAAGAARGLLYAAVVEPRLYGSPAVRGIVYGGIEYAISPWGGLGTLLGRHAPHRKLPFLDALFDGYDPADDTFVDHVAFAVAMAVLYGHTGADPDG